MGNARDLQSITANRLTSKKFMIMRTRKKYTGSKPMALILATLLGLLSFTTLGFAQNATDPAEPTPAAEAPVAAATVISVSNHNLLTKSPFLEIVDTTVVDVVPTLPFKVKLP